MSLLDERTGRRAALWVPTLTGLLTGLPLLAFVLRFGVAAPLSLFQADAFYYLDLTRNSVGRPGFTFDTVHQTNGFHPLWQWLLSGSTRLGWLQFADPLRALVHVFLLDLVLLTLGAALFTAFSARQLRFRPLALLASAPGLLWFVAAPIIPFYLSTWSYANGMESAVSLLMFATAVLLCAPGARSRQRDLAFSLALGLAVLARLDDIFFAIALLVWAAASLRLSLTRLLRWATPAVVLVGAYLLYNRTHVGVFLPLSGAAKAGLAWNSNLRWAGKLLVPMLTRRPPLALGLGPAGAFPSEAIRAFQEVVPAVLCGLELGFTLRRHRRFGIVQALCCGVLLKAGYNFFFVNGFNQGFWYYTVSVAVTNLVLVLWIDRLLDHVPAPSLPRAAVWLPFAVAVPLYAFSAFYGTLAVSVPAWPLHLIQHGPALRAQLEAQGDHCFTELNDGILSYALDLPAQSGLGLALDLQATQAMRAGHLLPTLVSRGCSLLLTGPDYTASVNAYLQGAAWQRGVSLFPIQPREFDTYTLVPLGTLDKGEVSAYRIQPRAQAAGAP